MNIHLDSQHRVLLNGRVAAVTVVGQLRDGRHLCITEDTGRKVRVSAKRLLPLFTPGTPVLWAGERWTVREWQPENGPRGAYWLRNSDGQDGVASHGELQELTTCSICRGPIEPVGDWTQGHNAQPVNEGRCCGDCNANVVVPARLREFRSRFPRESRGC